MSIDTDFTSAEWPASILVIGCGLMGASFALAIRQARPGLALSGVELSESHRTIALSLGAFDDVFSTLEAATAVCQPDLVVLATPVDAAVSLLASLRFMDCTIMDICSVKAPVCEAARSLDLVNRFAPTHPMAGMASEGPTEANAGLFVDKPWILIEQWPVCHRLVPIIEAVGARPVYVPTPESHDQAMAAVSHAVHLVSLATMQAYDNSQNAHHADWASLTGPGFRDVTRLSGSAPGFWVSTLHSNAEAVKEQIDRVVRALNEFQSALENGDQKRLRVLLASANEAFARWKSGHRR